MVAFEIVGFVAAFIGCGMVWGVEHVRKLYVYQPLPEPHVPVMAISAVIIVEFLCMFYF